MSSIDEVFAAAESLSPDDRVALIAQLWKSLPHENWPRPSADERVEAARLLAKENVSRNEAVPWSLVERIVADSVRSSRPRVYSAPRRFDLATILIVTAGYAILFGALRMLFSDSDYAAGTALIVGIFVTLVGIGQAWMYGGHRPRTASIVVGVILMCLILVGATLVFSQRGMPGLTFFGMIIYGVVSGVIYGYLAGVLVGGVFLVADVVRHRFKRDSASADADSQSAADPFDAS